MQRAPDLRARRDSGEIGILFLAKSRLPARGSTE
jgi:hypothetical protein